jgi:PAS domain S-box-containing protein
MKKYTLPILFFSILISQISVLTWQYINDTNKTHNIATIISVAITYIIIFWIYTKTKKEKTTFAKIFEESTEGIALIEKETQKIHIANKAICEMLEYSEKEIKYLYIADIINEKNFIQTTNEFEKFKEKEKILLSNITLETKQKHSIETNITAYTNKINKKEYITIFVRDISQTSSEKKEMKNLQLLYETAIEASENILFNWDHASDNITFAGQTLQILGYKCQEIEGNISKWKDLIHPEDLSYFEMHVKNMKEKNTTTNLEYRFLKKDGTYIYIENSGKFIKTEQGTMIMAGFIKNIDKRKKREISTINIAAELSQLSGKNFFEKITKYIAKSLQVEHVFVGKLIDDNKIKVLGGFSKDKTMKNMEYELKGTPCENVVGKQMCIYESNVQKEFPKDILLQEMKIEGYIGNPLFNEKNEAIGLIVALSENKLANQANQIQILKNLSNQIESKIELINAEEELKKHKNKLSTITQNSIPVIFMINKKGEFTLSEGEALKALGLKPKEAVGKSAFKMYKDYPQIIEGIEKALDGETNTNRVKINSNERESFWKIFYSPIKNEKNEITGVIGTGTDITSEQELEKIKEKQKIISELMTCGLIEINKDGEVQEKNTAIEKIIKNGTPLINENNKIHPIIFEKIENSRGIGGVNIKIKILDKEFKITWSEFLNDQNTLITIDE